LRLPGISSTVGVHYYSDGSLMEKGAVPITVRDIIEALETEHDDE